MNEYKNISTQAQGLVSSTPGQTTTVDLLTNESKARVEDAKKVRVIIERSEILMKSVPAFVIEVLNGQHPDLEVPKSYVNFLVNEQQLISPDLKSLTLLGKKNDDDYKQRMNLLVEETQNAPTVVSYAETVPIQKQETKETPQIVRSYNEGVILNNFIQTVNGFKNSVWLDVDNLILFEKYVSDFISRNTYTTNGVNSLQSPVTRAKILNHILDFANSVEKFGEKYLENAVAKNEWRTLVYDNYRKFLFTNETIAQLFTAFERKIPDSKFVDDEKEKMVKEEVEQVMKDSVKQVPLAKRRGRKPKNS